MSRRAEWLMALALAMVVGFGFQGSRGLFETTEGRYAESAREMLASGDYLEPTLAGRPHWTKPPPVYWSIAAGLRLAGQNAWGARLANAAAFVATVMLVAGLGASLWDARTGLVAALVYATSLFPVVAANVVSADTLLTLVETGAMLAYVRAYRTPDPAGGRWWVRAMWAAFGLAFFVKGPPGLLPLAAVIAFQRVHRRPSPRLVDGWGLLLFLAIGGWWYVASALRHPGLLGYFVGDEVVGRVLTAEHHRNPEWYKPALIYLPVLVFGSGAWLVYAMPTLRRAQLLDRGAWRRRRERGDAALFLALWLLVPLLIFSLARSRLPLYVLPLYVPIALGLARAVAVRWPAPAERLPRPVVRLALLCAMGLVLLKGVAAQLPSPSDMGALAGDIRARAGHDAGVWLVGEDKMFGLDFYLDGRVRRVSRGGRERWADGSLDALLREVAAGRAPPRTLIATGAWSDSLRQVLSHTSVAWTVIPLRGRDMFVVEPPVTSAQTPPMRDGAARHGAFTAANAGRPGGRGQPVSRSAGGLSRH